jgi:hypothetical protein
MAGNLKNYIDYYRRHSTPEQFAAWAVSAPRVQAYLEREQKIPAAIRALDDLQRNVLKKVMAPAIEKGSAFLATVEKSAVPRMRSGTLRQSIGSMKAKLYFSSLTAWVASGPRRGYGRLIVAQMRSKGIKLRRTSKKFTEQHRGQISTFANPVRYAHFLITGRQASVAGAGRKKAKSLCDPFTGRFFGHSVRAAAPRDFMAPAAASGDQAAAIATEEMNTKLQEVLSS